MTGLHVAEHQPLWLSLQHTPPSLEISDTPADAAVGAAGILVDIVDTFVVIADSAGLLYLQLHPFVFQFPLIQKSLVCLHSCRWLNISYASEG